MLAREASISLIKDGIHPSFPEQIEGGSPGESWRRVWAVGPCRASRGALRRPSAL